MKFSNSTRVIVQRHDPLNEYQITQALTVSEETPWWVALVQLIEGTRQDYIERASAGVDKGNGLAVARDIGAYEALSNLLVVLEKKRAGD